MSEDRKTATQVEIDDDSRMDLRRHRAAYLTAAVMRALGDTIEGRERGVHDKLFDSFYEEGWDVVTDSDRARLGLPPRDGKGWTMEEVADYRHRLAAARFGRLTPMYMDEPE